MVLYHQVQLLQGIWASLRAILEKIICQIRGNPRSQSKVIPSQAPTIVGEGGETRWQTPYPDNRQGGEGIVQTTKSSIDSM